MRQGSLLSPYFFNVYVDGLHHILNTVPAGCFLGSTKLNSISYADDMVLISPSLEGLRKMVLECELFANSHKLVYNSEKSKLLVFKPHCYKDLIVPRVRLNNQDIERVSEIKYLGHFITDTLSDIADIERHYKGLCVRANMLSRRFSKCSTAVKNFLFKTFCGSLYAGELWCNHTVAVWRTLRVCYNDSFRILHRLPRYNSASEMFANARVDTLDALRRKAISSFVRRLFISENSLLKAFLTSDSFWSSLVIQKWRNLCF